MALAVYKGRWSKLAAEIAGNGFDYLRNRGSGEITVAMSELEMLQRDINGLLNANILDWQALANEPMSSEQRIVIRKAIAARNVDLLDWLQRKWILEEAGGDQ